MATRIELTTGSEYHTTDGGRDPLIFCSHIAGFCKESPREVLQRIFDKYRVHLYRSREVFPIWCSGLSIYDPKLEKVDMEGFRNSLGYSTLVNYKIIKTESEKKKVISLRTLPEILTEFKNTELWRKKPWLFEIDKLLRVDKIRTYNREGLTCLFFKNKALEAGTTRRGLAEKLLTDKPLREICEVLLKKPGLRIEELEKYLIENKIRPSKPDKRTSKERTREFLGNLSSAGFTRLDGSSL